jgi:Ser/Thr protein kinase RdoA (MazF antagonist)
MFYFGRHVYALKYLLFQDFSHPGLKSRLEQNFRWNILEFFNLDKYIGGLKEGEETKLYREVYEVFVTKVKAKLRGLQWGSVHNDLNGENILVSKPPYVVTGVFDFGDAVESLLISELSNSMAFFMEGERGIEFSGHILAGYQSSFSLPKLERELLYYFVAVRLGQLALYSQCSLVEQPNDESVQACMNKYLSTLRSFWGRSKDEVEKIWQKCELNCFN